jgi:23S rRNA (guanosine2251-2'-O)-methyltransferase
MDYLGGIHAVKQLLSRYPKHVKFIWVVQRSQHSNWFSSACRQHDVPLSYVNKSDLDDLLPDIRHQGVVAEYTQLPTLGLEDLCAQSLQRSKTPCLLMLDRVQDPQNLGACLRSAAVFGVDGVIIPKDRAVGVTPTVLKVAVGAAAMVPVVRVANLTRAMRLLKAQGFWLYGTAETADQTITQADVDVPIVWVMGNESKGLGHQVEQHCDVMYRIDTTGFSTLNIATSAGIVLHTTFSMRGASR